jgi:hypothetical protein
MDARVMSVQGLGLHENSLQKCGSLQVSTGSRNFTPLPPTLILTLGKRCSVYFSTERVPAEGNVAADRIY